MLKYIFAVLVIIMTGCVTKVDGAETEAFRNEATTAYVSMFEAGEPTDIGEEFIKNYESTHKGDELYVNIVKMYEALAGSDGNAEKYRHKVMNILNGSFD